LIFVPNRVLDRLSDGVRVDRLDARGAIVHRAVGIILRGAAYALRSGAASRRESSVIDTIFSISSILTPFALGTAVGGIASRRVPVGNGRRHVFSSWLNPNPPSIMIGVIAVPACAYLAAVYSPPTRRAARN